MVGRVASGFATDCNSLYDVCRKHGSLPSERRVALDLLDLREGLEEFGDQVRWIPTTHMLADALTKHMPPDLILKVMRDCKYAFKYSADIENAKKHARTERARLRTKTAHTDAQYVHYVQTTLHKQYVDTLSENVFSSSVIAASSSTANSCAASINNIIYVADVNNHRIRKITPTTTGGNKITIIARITATLSKGNF
jgi:hypothetical protein